MGLAMVGALLLQVLSDLVDDTTEDLVAPANLPTRFAPSVI